MVGEDRTHMTHEEFERMSKQFNSDKEDAMNIWPLGPSKFEQGIYLGIRRHLRFFSYQAYKNRPALFFEKSVPNAYLPFSMRHHLFLMGCISFGYVLYSAYIKAKHTNR